MMSQLRPAVILFLLLTLLTGVAYPLAVMGDRAGGLPASSQWQRDRARRQGGRLGIDRAILR